MDTHTYLLYKPGYFLFQDCTSTVSYACEIINMNMKECKNFKQGIGIAEKSQETRRDRWGGNVNHKFQF